MKNITRIFIAGLVLFSGSTFSQEVIKGTFAIKNVSTGLVLRIKDANKAIGTPVVAYSPVNWKCVTWNFMHLGNNTYVLQNLFTGKTFEPKRKPSEGVTLEQRDVSTDKQTQQYEFLQGENKSYLIRLKGTSLYLTPGNTKAVVNSNIILAPRKGSEQYWTISEQHPDI